MNEAVTQIIEALRPIAEKLGEGGEFAYETIYSQVIAEAIVYGILSILFLVALMVASVAVRKKWEQIYDGDWEIIVVMILFSGWLFWLISGVAALVKSTLTLLNPHYYTIEKILTIIKSGGQL